MFINKTSNKQPTFIKKKIFLYKIYIKTLETKHVHNLLLVDDLYLYIVTKQNLYFNKWPLKTAANQIFWKRHL